MNPRATVNKADTPLIQTIPVSLRTRWNDSISTQNHFTTQALTQTIQLKTVQPKTIQPKPFNQNHFNPNHSTKIIQSNSSKAIFAIVTTMAGRESCTCDLLHWFTLTVIVMWATMVVGGSAESAFSSQEHRVYDSFRQCLQSMHHRFVVKDMKDVGLDGVGADSVGIDGMNSTGQVENVAAKFVESLSMDQMKEMLSALLLIHCTHPSSCHQHQHQPQHQPQYQPQHQPQYQQYQHQNSKLKSRYSQSKILQHNWAFVPESNLEVGFDLVSFILLNIHSSFVVSCPILKHI